MKTSRRAGHLCALGLGPVIFALVAACSTGGTPSAAAPPETVTTTVSATTVVRTTSTVTATLTVTPATTADRRPLVVATFKDASTFECSDASADSCWALDATTSGPCPNGVYVAINVYKQGEDAVLQVLEATSAPVTDELGGTVTVQLSQTGLAPGGETLEARLKEARCA